MNRRKTYMKLYFYCTKMAANGGKECSATCSMMFIILCLLCSMACATTLTTDSHNHSSNNFTSSSPQSFAYETINAGGGTTAVIESSSCDTTLENGPKNKTRIEGERVSLICDLIDENNRDVVWVYLSGPGKRRYISINDYIYDRQDKDNYKVVIDESLQTYKLKIMTATFPTDSGVYQCGYQCNSGRYIPLASAVVTIFPKFDPSISITGIIKSRPTTTTMLSEATESVTSPMTPLATNTTDISESTRPTTATRMFSKVTTITVTTHQTLAATTPNTGTSQTPGALICKFYLLPFKESLDREFEVVCSWNHSQAYQAQLQISNGETIENYFTFASRIVSRVSGSKSINCRLSLNSNTSMAEINTPCIEENTYFIRVDPFVDEIDEGCSALFTCTFNDRGHPYFLSWKVHSSGNLSVDDPERIELYQNVNFAVYKQKDGEHLLVECHYQYGNRNMSSYGLLRIIEGTTSNPTTSVEGQTNQITDNQSFRTVESTTKQSNITETRPSVKMTTMKLTLSSEEGQTSQSVQTVKSTTNQKSINETRPSVKMTTMELLTSSREVQTSQSVQTVKSATNKNSITETRPPVKMTTTKFPPSSEGGQTSQITDNTSVQTREFTTDHDKTSETHTPPTSETHTPPSSKKGLVVMISVSVLVAVVILLLSLAIVYLLKKQKRMSLPRRLSEDDKTDKIELSNIPHILHEESSEWYALSFKDKRVQDIQGQQSNDLIVKHDDESDQNIPILSTSLGIPSLHLLESIDENVYAEPDVSEEPIRQTISRQQCTFTPLLEDEQ